MKRAEWTTHLRVAVDDVDAVTQDMLAPPRARQLGPAKHRALYESAASMIAHLLANPPDPDEHGDPAGPGGADAAPGAGGAL